MKPLRACLIRSCRCVIVTISAAITIGCAATGGQPDWIENPAAQYPDLVYMTGIGDGPDMESAAAAATSDLAAVFESRVESTTRVREKLEQGEEGSVLTSVTDIDVAIRTAQKIEGVKIGERWQNSSGQHFALAVLQRDEAIRDLADRMRGHEQAMRTSLEFAGKQKTPLERFRALLPTAELAVERDVWAAQYRVLGDRFWSAAPMTAMIENQLETALAAVTFTVDAIIIEAENGSARFNSTFAKAIGDVVNESGFRVNPGNDGNLLVVSRITLSEPFTRGKNNWQHYLWDASLEISANEPAARAFIVVEDNGSTSNPSADVARRAAIRQAENAVLERFNIDLEEYLSRTD